MILAKNKIVFLLMYKFNNPPHWFIHNVSLSLNRYNMYYLILKFPSMHVFTGLNMTTQVLQSVYHRLIEGWTIVFLPPMLLEKVEEPFDDERWLYEPKIDGH